MILVDGKNSKIDITSAHIESYNLWGSLELIRTCGVHGAKGTIVFDSKKGIYSWANHEKLDTKMLNIKIKIYEELSDINIRE